MKHFLHLVIFLSLLSFLNSASLIAQEETGAFTTSANADINAPFLVNPSPLQIDNKVTIPLEEVFGSNQTSFGPAGARGRGNIFYCTTPRKLIEQRYYLNPTAPANLWFVVYEGTDSNGIYNLVNSVNVLNQGPGEGWYSSGPIDFDFEAGKYYLIYTQWDVDAYYWNEQGIIPFPITCSFGELQAGVGWNWVPAYGDPPLATQDVQETFFLGIAYFQTIVTEEVLTEPIAPSNLNATTVGSTSIELTWDDNSVNEDGFLIQRKLGISGTFNDLTTVGSDDTSFTDVGLVPGNEYCYRVNAFNTVGSSPFSTVDCATTDPVSVEEFEGIPDKFALYENFPNPFNPSTTIYFAVSELSFIEITVYDAIGTKVGTLVSESKEAGYHKITFDASLLNSGVYFYRLETDNFSQTRKMVLMK